MNQIIIEKYNPEWAEFFFEESARIASVAGNCLVDLYHVGSTSVPGLSAKPIVDMIFVATDLSKAQEILTSEKLGYRLKGEYNLPLHDLYGKKGKFEIYLHVHLYGSSEIKLNLMFRDYLRAHPEACEEYVRAKIYASQIKDAAERVDTGVTRYNLMKNDVLTALLKKTGFSELCARFVTQESEHKAFRHIKWFNAPEWRGLQKKSKKIVLYQGVDIIGAAEFCDFGRNYFEIMFVISDTDEGFLRLINVIENWIKIRTTTRLIFVSVTKKERAIYESLGYFRDSSLRGIVLVKKL